MSQITEAGPTKYEVSHPHETRERGFACLVFPFLDSRPEDRMLRPAGLQKFLEFNSLLISRYSEV